MTGPTPEVRDFATAFADAFRRERRPLVILVLGVSVAFVIFVRLSERSDRIELQRELQQQLVEIPGADGTPTDRPLETMALIEWQIEDIRETSGVQVHFLYDPRRYFPQSWIEEPVSAKGSQVPLGDLRHVLPVIRRFLSAYPSEVLKSNLSSIYLLQDMSFYGKGYGGSYTRSAIYITSAEGGGQYGDRYLLGMLHSEFSSILMENYNFPDEEWIQTNASDFEYQEDSRDIVDMPVALGQTEDLLREGFIVRYARTDLENDFNMIAHWLFAEPSASRSLARKHERIRQKMDLAEKFYESISPNIQIP